MIERKPGRLHHRGRNANRGAVAPLD
jgi:hypothetical protein